MSHVKWVMKGGAVVENKELNKTEARMLTPEEEIIPPMPLRLSELRVLMRCLMTALKSEGLSDKEKGVARQLAQRIDRFAERQGASWDKIG